MTNKLRTLMREFERFLNKKATVLDKAEFKRYSAPLRKRSIDQNTWNDVAPFWSNIEFTREPEYWINLMRQIIPKALQWPSKSILLSVGSGSALMEIFLAEKILKGGSVICLDYAHQMSIEARKITQSRRASNVFFLTADAVKPLPFKSRSIDFLLCSGVLEYFTEVEQGIAMAEFDRVLRLPKTPTEMQVFVNTQEWVKSSIGSKF